MSDLARWRISLNKDGGPRVDRELKDLVDVEAPVNRRERRAAAAWKRKQARAAQQSGEAS